MSCFQLCLVNKAGSSIIVTCQEGAGSCDKGIEGTLDCQGFRLDCCSL